MLISNYDIYFDNLLDNMLEGVAIHEMIFDDNGKAIDYRVLKVNKGFEKILGFKKEESEGKLASELYGNVPALSDYSDIVLNKISRKFDYYYPSMKRYFNVSVAPWDNIGFITIFSDITDFINKNEFNKNLIQTIPYKMEIVDKYGTILFINQIMLDEMGDVVGKKCWDIHHDDRKQCANCPLHTNIKIGITKTIETHNSYYGKFYEISHTGIIFNNEEAVLEIFQDITERKKYENRLSRAEIISKTGNWEYHINKNLVVVSDGAKKIYGLEKGGNEFKLEEIKKYPLSEYRTLLDDSLKDLVENNKQYDVEFKIKSNKGDIKTVRSVANYDSSNKIIFGILQDITIQKQNEEALEKSNAVKSVFLSTISHELRTPMNAIIGFSDIILSNNKNKESERFLKSINSNAKHLDELLNNILDYSKIESDALDILYEKFSVNDLFDELYDMFEDLNYRKNLDFVKMEFIKNKDKKISSDYLRLKQVLYNIISNSIKFTEKGIIKLSFTFDYNYITFKVEDTGIGIPKDQLSYVFDRFWQFDSGTRKKYKGTGLGLSISKSIVELLNGDIWLESEFNKGTTFHIKVPLREKITKIKINKKIDFTKKNILIVDDIPIIYSLLGIYLNSLNINIIYANGGKEAIEIYKKQKEKIDIIIIDLNLFDINGIELIKIMKNLCGDCKIISKSGIKDQKSELVDYHLKKPINKERLFSILNEIWQK